MEKKKYFCEECRNEMHIRISDMHLEGTLKGKVYSYQGKAAFCTGCGLELYVAEINDFNLRALYNEYRKEHHILSLDKISEIPVKYAIGKRPLSLLLGWGEQTFSRYCNGDMPTKQYSDILRKIYEEPQYYAELLERNKENLSSELTYNKSKKAVLALLHGNADAQSNINRAIDYLLCQNEEITPLALQKALYYIQGFYFAFYKSFLFAEDCQAWVHGPVYKEIYNRYRNCLSDAIKADTKIDASNFSSEERAIMDSVIANICCYSGKTLERFTHAETPWLTARGNLPEDIASDNIIRKELIGDYFNSIIKRYQMKDPQDIKKYAQDMFEKQC